MKEVTIMGRAPGYVRIKEIAQGDFWAVSSAFHLVREIREPDLIFQLHSPETWEDWIQQERKRVITSFEYPITAMVNKYGAVFGSSIAWMIALAIEKGYEKINLVGLDMATEVEYIDQRDTLFYWIGRAEASGITVCIPDDSRIFFKDRIYGVNYENNKSPQ